MPYRIDLRNAGDDALDRLIDLGALDAEQLDDGSIAAVMPDRISREEIASAVGAQHFSISPAAGRDDGSVWVLSPRPVQIGRIRIVPSPADASPNALRLIDSEAFGTGLHPTTALCLEALEEAALNQQPEAVLDVGTGTGVLALAALMLGVPRAVGIDIDGDALRVAAENARINMLHERIELTRGGPETIGGTWPLVLANVLAAPLIAMAPTLVRRVGHHGRLVLSGIPTTLEQDVSEAYRRLGMQHLRTASRAGWVALVMHPSW
jgi:ribosomal protein L11 methyltransferase